MEHSLIKTYENERYLAIFQKCENQHCCFIVNKIDKTSQYLTEDFFELYEDFLIDCMNHNRKMLNDN